MAETYKVVDGKVEITKSQDIVVSTMTKEEIVGKIAEAQTKVDHLNIDLAAAQLEVDKWNNILKEVEKEK